MELRSALQQTLETRAAALTSWLPAAREDTEDAVHQVRVTARRLRSVLQVYKPLFDPAERSAVNRSLRDLGRCASPARDAEVILELVEARVASPTRRSASGSGLLTPQTLARLRRDLTEQRLTGHRSLTEALSSSWLQEALDRLERFTEIVPLHPELTEAQLADAAATLSPLAQAQVDVVLSLGRQAEQEDRHEKRMKLLHEVRKEAKRLRYAVKAVRQATGLTLGGDLSTQVKLAEKLQDALGAHRDSLMLQDHLHRTARQARAVGEDTFGYGMLFAEETAVQEGALARASRKLSRLAEAADDVPAGPRSC